MSSGVERGKLYLVDAHSLIFQVFFAIRGMSSPSGVPTNALFGFVRDLLFLRGLQPDYLICAFDRHEPTFRSAIYPDYKAHREEMPSDLVLQIPLIQQATEAMSIPVLEVAGFEADDILATLARVGAERDLDVRLCTADKDCRQLLGDRVRIYNLRKQEEFGPAELLADWGVRPDQVVDLQALVGDSVDNVPGVPGIGLKTGAKLLQEFDTLDNLLANIDKVAGAKKQESLRASADLVAVSRKLVRLDQHVPLSYDWDNWRLRPMHVERLMAMCREWGFQGLAQQIRTQARAEEKPVQAELFSAEELFPFGANVGEADATASTSAEAAPSAPAAPAGSAWQAQYTLVDTAEAFDALLTQLQQQPRFAFDLETTSLSPLDAQIVGIALCWQEGQAYYLALRGPAGSALLDEPRVLDALRPLLADPARAKINQNIKYDLLVLSARGVPVAGVAGDPMVADYLLHAGERSHGLEELSRRYLNHQVITITELIGKKKPKQPQLTMDEVPTARVAEYAAEDADVAWRLAHLLEEKLLAQPPLRNLYDEVEVPLIEVLAAMEFHGIRLDTAYLARLGEEMGGHLTTIEAGIYQLAGHPFNIGSLPQLRTVLFDELKLPVQGRTGVTGAASTDQETLEKLAALDHPAAELPRKILEHRQISKLKGTYVDALPGMVNARTGRIHASFNQTVAATGRLSSSDPNLQNIPVRREMGQQIRRAFVAEPGHVLLTADYSQIELRLLAHFCQDEELCRAFAERRDVHTAVAAQIFHVSEADVTAEQRRMAKTVNFGVIYGISATGLAQRLEIKRDAGAEFIEAYFKRYPRVEAYQKALLEGCRERGYVATILGRRRLFDRSAIRPHSSFQNRNQAEREAINCEVQGSAADLIKLAMLHLHRRLTREQFASRLLLQIHDELVFEAPQAELARLAEVVQHEMVGPVAQQLGLRVPLEVDIAVGPNWLDVESLEAAP
ncbi:MAG: DNA polymerase I [Gemmataceae bacterium]